MTSARSQLFCKKRNFNIGCYDGCRVCPKNISERNTELYMYMNHFCLIGKSNAISFNKAKDGIKINFKNVCIMISDKHG